MKEKEFFFNPFRLISSKLDAEASRLKEHFEAPPPEVTCLEEGLLVMCSKLVDLSRTLYKTFLIAEPQNLERCKKLAAEIHNEEKILTGQLVHSTVASGKLLKSFILFPGRFERVGDLLESVINVSILKDRNGIPFSDKAMAELKQLFDLFASILENFRDVLMTRNKTILDHLMIQHGQLAQMTMDFALAHEDRLIEGLCSPKASSLYMDILDSMRSANRQIREMTENLIKVSDTPEAMAS